MLNGQVKQGKNEHAPSLVLDADGRTIQGACTCNFYQQNELRKGPCEHMLAIRLQHQRQVH